MLVTATTTTDRADDEPLGTLGLMTWWLLVALSARRGRLVQFYGLPFTDTSLPTLIFIHNQLITAAEWRKERAATLNE